MAPHGAVPAAVFLAMMGWPVASCDGSYFCIPPPKAMPGAAAPVTHFSSITERKLWKFQSVSGTMVVQKSTGNETYNLVREWPICRNSWCVTQLVTVTRKLTHRSKTRRQSSPLLKEWGLNSVNSSCFSSHRLFFSDTRSITNGASQPQPAAQQQDAGNGSL